jgi:hypothetical protein
VERSQIGVNRAEKLTAAVAALSSLESAFAREGIEGELKINAMERARQYTICSNRREFDVVVSKLEELVRQARGGRKMTGAHLAEIWPVKSESTPPSLERLEAIKAYALRVRSSVDDLHTPSQATPEILKPLGVGRALS